MYDPYFITWEGVFVHLLLMLPLAIFAWKYGHENPDELIERWKSKRKEKNDGNFDV